MRFFLTEAERKRTHSTCYHEFARGKWDEAAAAYWREDSLNIHDDYMVSLGLDELLAGVLPGYNPFGPTEVSAAQWEKLCANAEATGGELWQAVGELIPWAAENFARYPAFTILGV